MGICRMKSGMVSVNVLFFWWCSDKALTSKTVGRSSVVVKMSDSNLRALGLESSCCHFETWAISFTPRCFCSFSCINEYLAIDSGGYM